MLGSIQNERLVYGVTLLLDCFFACFLAKNKQTHFCYIFQGRMLKYLFLGAEAKRGASVV